MVIFIEVEVSFKFDDNEVNEIDLGLKIGAFVVIYFCFTSGSFL